MSSVYALSFHADYKCRHSGACCTADWDVPVELPIYRSLEDAVTAGRLQVAPAASPLAPFIVEPDLPDDAAAMIERTDRGDCVFFERGTHLCVVHRDMGESALPATCRHFPRVAVRDTRGTFITLSHFCPTAAGMLFRDDVETRIVEGPPAFPPMDYDGLVVADEDLPPLLGPRMLMDGEGYTAWERHMVARCSDGDTLPESVMATLWRDARILRRWTPETQPLAAAVAALPSEPAVASEHANLETSLAAYREAMTAVPDDLKPAPDEDGLDAAFDARVRPAWRTFTGPLNRYLAAKAFASWTAYQGRGILAIVRGLEVALALVRVEASRQCRDHARTLDRDLLLEAIRSADFVLNHLAVGEDLADAWSNVAITGP